MNFAVRLLECKGFDAILVAVDRLSKMRHFIPCHTTIDAAGLAELFSKEVVCLHELPAKIVSDWECQCASTCWGQLCNRLGTE